MLEHKRTILLVHVFVEAQPWPRTREQACKRCLTHDERIAPQVVAVKLDQVEASASTMSGKRSVRSLPGRL
jgi:hypothetical protein